MGTGVNVASGVKVISGVATVGVGEIAGSVGSGKQETIQKVTDTGGPPALA